jgi:hypothetical protein
LVVAFQHQVGIDVHGYAETGDRGHLYAGRQVQIADPAADERRITTLWQQGVLAYS